MIDPVSNNKVPPGAAPEEVRDEHDAKLSTGEYVLPADVVRYLGVEKIEALVRKAKDALVAMSGEDLPFSEEDLQTVEDQNPSPAQTASSEGPMKMATGGLVMNPLQEKEEQYSQIPPWMIDNSNSSKDDNIPQSLDGTIAGNVDTWKPETFDTYAKGIDSVGGKFVEGFISSVMPMGKVALEHRYNYLNEAVPKNLDKMLSTGKDLQGNTLSEGQLSSLREAKAKISAAGERTVNTSLVGAIADPVIKAFGLDKTLQPVKDFVNTVKAPIKEVKKAISEPIKETLKSVGEDIGSGIIGRQKKTEQKTTKNETGSSTDKSNSKYDKSEKEKNKKW